MKSSKQSNNQQYKRALSQYDELEQLQEHLDDLKTDRESMEIIFTSLKNAFRIYPVVEEEEIDKEICRAYDDLMAQVRHLDRSLKRLDKSIKLTEQKAAMSTSNRQTATLLSNQQTTMSNHSTP